MVDRSSLFIGHIKKFLQMEFGGDENILVHRMNDEVIGFKIRSMQFILRCKDLTVSRALGVTPDGNVECVNAFDDTICELIERKIRSFIETRTVGKTMRDVYLESMSLM